MSFHNNNINFYQSNLVRLSIKNNLNQINHNHNYTYRSDVLNCVIHIIRNDIFFNEINQLYILDLLQDQTEQGFKLWLVVMKL